MIRGVLSGLVWGGVSVALVAMLASLLMPLPDGAVPGTDATATGGAAPASSEPARSESVAPAEGGGAQEGPMPVAQAEQLPQGLPAAVAEPQGDTAAKAVAAPEPGVDDGGAEDPGPEEPGAKEPGAKEPGAESSGAQTGAAKDAGTAGVGSVAVAPPPPPQVGQIITAPPVALPGLSAPAPASAEPEPGPVAAGTVPPPEGAAQDAALSAALAPEPPAPVTAPDGSSADVAVMSGGAASSVPVAPGAEGPAASGPLAQAPQVALPDPSPGAPGGLVPEPQPEPQPIPSNDAPQPAADAAPPQVAGRPARPQPGFAADPPSGVRTDRLPRIGAPADDAPVAALRALDRNARAFDNPSDKPPFAVLLLDDPGSAVDLAGLAAGALPLTLVIDPTAPGAAERAALWREAGQEVALLTNALPAQGRASDYEVALESLMAAFPQMLALVDSGDGGLQGDRAAAVALLPALAARGLGLVTWDRGLNAADQLARRERLPAATIFRDLDAAAETAPVIRRYLDRAAFKAQQDGRAVVIGRLRPETLAALAEWSLDGRAATLALAPVSALLAGP